MGIGPIAGPIVVAAVLLNPKDPISELKDSKKFGSREKRDRIGYQIMDKALWYDFRVKQAIDLENKTNMKLESEIMILDILTNLPDGTSDKEVLIDGNPPQWMKEQYAKIYPVMIIWMIQSLQRLLLPKL